MYRKLTLVMITVFAIASVQSHAGDAVKDDLAKLNGTWVPVKITFGQEKEAKGKELADVKLVFAGQKLIQYGGGKSEETTFTIDPTKKPKAIDITVKEKVTTPGIYQIKGDTLMLAIAGIGVSQKKGDDTNKNKPKFAIGERPTDFQGKGTVVVFTLKRKLE